MTDIDPFADIPDGPTETGLAKLKSLLDRQRDKAQKVAALEAELKLEKEDLRMIEEKEFPDLFDEVGVDSFRADGLEVEIANKLYGSLPTKDEARAAALEELRKYDGLGVLKAEINMQFAKSEADRAEQLAKNLEEAGYTVVLREGVHPQTYQAWAREKREAGEPIDLDILGLYNRRFVKIKELK